MEDHQLENSTILVIPLEDQDAIRHFWEATGAMEEETKAEVAVEITLPEPRDGVSGEAPEVQTTPQETPAPPVVEPAATETPAVEASLPTPQAEETTQPTPTETRVEEPQPEAEAPAPEAAPAQAEQAPAPAPEVYRNRVTFRKICGTCEAAEFRTKCTATSCLACGDDFVLIFEDEADDEEARAKLSEETRPDCNPKDEGTAYCKTCLLDWFDNSMVWPHRETLPQHEGESVLELVVPFVSDAYMKRIRDIQAYWDDKEKLFCPVPTCSAYIPRSTYTITKEETITKTVTKPAKVKEEVAAASETQEQNIDTTAAAAPETTTETTVTTETTETTAPVATTTEQEERNITVEPEAVVQPAAQVNTETTVEVNTEPTANTEPTVTENTETAGQTTVEPNTEAIVESTTEVTAEVTTEATTEGTAEPTTEPTTNTNAPAAEPVTEEKAVEPTPELETETITEIVKKEYKTRLAICTSPTCQTPVCTLCRSHFHGLDTPCASRTDFFKEFMLSKFTKQKKEKAGENTENGEANGEQNANEDEDDDDDTDGEYDEDGEYEEYPNRYRQCVNCQNLVARHTGCDHMTCACGAAFCFYCGGEYGQYHSCLSDDDYLIGEGVGGIKITTDEGFLDDEGAAIVVNPLGVITREEEEANIAKWLDVIEFTENDEPRKSWKVKAGVEIEGPVKDELIFTEEENARLAKPMKDWKGKYY
ncbi:hypothetical protein TWF718_002385 [Orbilia javanica]